MGTAWINSLQPNVPFLYLLKTFSGSIEMEHWAKMGELLNFVIL